MADHATWTQDDPEWVQMSRDTFVAFFERQELIRVVQGRRLLNKIYKKMIKGAANREQETAAKKAAEEDKDETMSDIYARMFMAKEDHAVDCAS